jgi:hypothetical protein
LPIKKFESLLEELEDLEDKQSYDEAEAEDDGKSNEVYPKLNSFLFYGL